MRRLQLLVLAFALAGCGSTAQQTGVLASSGVGSVPAETSQPAETTFEPTDTTFDESRLKPPSILLRSSAGEQKAVEGSFCVDYVDRASGRGSGVCGDSPAVHPDAITVVRPGDEVRFVFDRAEIVRSEGCHSDDEQSCIGHVYVRPLGCEDREVDRVPLAPGPETRWTVHLERGAYELDVFAYFESSEGATGDVSGALGLLVGGGPKKHDYRGILAVKGSMQVCAFAD